MLRATNVPKLQLYGGERAKNSHLSYNLQLILLGIAQTEAILWLIFILAIVWEGWAIWLRSTPLPQCRCFRVGNTTALVLCCV